MGGGEVRIPWALVLRQVAGVGVRGEAAEELAELTIPAALETIAMDYIIVHALHGCTMILKL